MFFVFNLIVLFISLPLSNPARATQPGTVVASVIVSILFFLVFIFFQGGALGLTLDLLKKGGV